MSAQVIEKDGAPAFAVVPWKEWEAVLERLEQLEDIADADRVMNAIEAGEETYPHKLVERLLSEENPIKVWREYRNMTASSLAEAVGVSNAAISQFESGARSPSVETLKRMADTLNVDMDDLVVE